MDNYSYVVIGFCLFGLMAASMAILPAILGPKPSKPAPKYVSRRLPDIEFDGVLIRPVVDEHDKQLEVRWKIMEKS